MDDVRGRFLGLPHGTTPAAPNLIRKGATELTFAKRRGSQTHLLTPTVVSVFTRNYSAIK